MAAPRTFGLTLSNVRETMRISWPTVVDAFWGRGSLEACDERLRGWSQAIVQRMCPDLRVVGRENVPAERACVIMSNHVSHYDVPILFHAVGCKMRMVAKKELFTIPIFGPSLKEAGFISIDRDRRQSALRSLDEAKTRLGVGRHIWIAPEGKRSPTGELLPFKRGGFYLARQGGHPILPISLRGTRDILPAGTVRSQAGAKVVVTIHPLIEPEAFPDDPDGRSALSSKVRATIESALYGE